MNTEKRHTNDEIEIDLSRVIQAVMKKLWVVVIITLFSVNYNRQTMNF